MRVVREQLFDADAAGDDPLLQRGLNDFLERLAVGPDSIGKRVFARDLHHPPVHLVDRRGLLDPAALQALDVKALRLGEGIEDIRGEIRRLSKKPVSKKPPELPGALSTSVRTVRWQVRILKGMLAATPVTGAM